MSSPQVLEKWNDGFFKASDGVSLFYRVYQPAVPQRSLIILHGFGEHSHRYEKFAHYFPDFQISIFDMRGMGQSEGERVFVESFARYERDALDFLDFLRAHYSVSVPRLFLGHSMGGLTLMRLCTEHQLDAERFVFSAPCFRVAVLSAALSLNSWINTYYPRFLYRNPVYFKNLSHDEFEMLSYKNDPWIMRQMTARLLNEMVCTGKKVEALDIIRFEKPVHFLLAGEDKLVRTEIAKQVFEKIAAPSKTINVYKNFYHEIFNELNQAAVFQDLQKILSGFLPVGS